MWPWRTNNTSEIYFFLPPSHFILIFTVNTTFLIFNHIPLFVPFFDFLIFSPFYFEFTQFIIYSDVTCCPAVLGLLILKSTTNSIHNKTERILNFISNVSKKNRCYLCNSHCDKFAELNEPRASDLLQTLTCDPDCEKIVITSRWMII